MTTVLSGRGKEGRIQTVNTEEKQAFASLEAQGEPALPTLDTGFLVSGTIMRHTPVKLLWLKYFDD